MKRLPIFLFLVGIPLIVIERLWRPPERMITFLNPDAISIHYFSVHDTMQVVTTALVLGASLFVVLSKRYAAAEKHWAFATVGTILGFWLPK